MLADGVASLNAAYAVMMALYHRDVHGADGQLIDINLIDPLARLLEQSLVTFDRTATIARRAGNKWDISAPRNTYRTKDDKWLAMSGSAPTIALRVFRAIGRADLAEDPDFADPQRRLARSAEVDRMVAEWVSQRALADAMTVFETFEIAAAPVYDVAELIGDEQMRHREVFVRSEDPQLDSMLVQSPVPRFSDSAGIIDGLGPELGEHTPRRRTRIQRQNGRSTPHKSTSPTKSSRPPISRSNGRYETCRRIAPPKPKGSARPASTDNSSTPRTSNSPRRYSRRFPRRETGHDRNRTASVRTKLGRNRYVSG